MIIGQGQLVNLGFVNPPAEYDGFQREHFNPVIRFLIRHNDPVEKYPRSIAQSAAIRLWVNFWRGCLQSTNQLGSWVAVILIQASAIGADTYRHAEAASVRLLPARRNSRASLC